MAYGITFSPRTKSVLILIATLVLGALLGAVLTGWWVQNRVDRLRSVRTSDGFVERVVRRVEPVSAAQRDSIAEIAQYRARQLSDLRQSHRRHTRAILDSLRQDLQPVLTEEQAERLERQMPRHGRPGDRPRGRRGPRQP